MRRAGLILASMAVLLAPTLCVADLVVVVAAGNQTPGW